MKKHFILYFILMILLYSCSQNNRITKNSSTQLDTNRIVIFPSGLSKTSKNITLTEKEIIEVDKILNECIDSSYKFNSKKMNSRKFLSSYKRQYLPSINEKGEKVVWVNCFCTTNHFNWKTEIVDASLVSDGGDCYFNVNINLTTMRFDTFRKNGYG